MRDKTTSFDIAELAGVSQPTVSRALRGDPTVSEATRKRIEAIALQLNYRIDKNASSLRRGQSRTLALLFFQDPTPDDSLINPFFLSMLGSILRTCALRGYDLLTSFQQLSSNWHVEYEDSRKADGIILLGYGDFALYQERLEQLVAQGTHFVMWGSPRAGQSWTTMGCDNQAGAAADRLPRQCLAALSRIPGPLSRPLRGDGGGGAEHRSSAAGGCDHHRGSGPPSGTGSARPRARL
jgi:DNA-binding LacI/PurR family transcriptional regulator